MMLLAGPSRAVVPMLLANFRPAPLAEGAAACAGTPSAWPAAVLASAPDELAALFELAEHPARNIPPPSRTLPIMRPATAPGLVRPLRVRRRDKLRVFSMPLWRQGGTTPVPRADYWS